MSHLVIGRLNDLKNNAAPHTTRDQRGHHQIDGRVTQDCKTEGDKRIQRLAVGVRLSDCLRQFRQLIQVQTMLCQRL